MYIAALFCLIALALAYLISKIVIHLLAQHLLDQPNHRSSHNIPTPRGGGIAIYSSLIISLGLFSFSTQFDALLFLSVLIPATAIFILGLCDDFLNLHVLPRLATQILISAIAIALNWPHEVTANGLHLLIACIAILFLVALVNFYNFMDGINGIAASEAICACLGMGCIYWLTNNNQEDFYLLLILAGCSAGFLYWNFPTAKLFMGDSGSLLLGFILTLCALRQLEKSPELFISWLILLGGFIVDASLTLLVRIAHKQKFYLPHRTHAYQKAADFLGSHTLATNSLIIINIVWLFPLALAVSLDWLHAIAGLTLAYLPLTWIHIKLKGGRVTT